VGVELGLIGAAVKRAKAARVDEAKLDRRVERGCKPPADVGMQGKRFGVQRVLSVLSWLRMLRRLDWFAQLRAMMHDGKAARHAKLDNEEAIRIEIVAV